MENQETMINNMKLNGNNIILTPNLAKINIALYPLPKCSSPHGWTSEPARSVFIDPKSLRDTYGQPEEEREILISYQWTQHLTSH